MDHPRAPDQPPAGGYSPFDRDTDALADRIRRGEYSVDPELVAQAFIEWHRNGTVSYPADRAEI